MDACQAASEGRHAPRVSAPEEKEKAPHQRPSTTREDLATLSIGLQIIKMIVLRGGQEIESTVPGVWPKLARFLITTLKAANLAFTAGENSRSPAVSPSPSRTSSPAPGRLNRHSISSDNHGSSLSHILRQHVRVLDYLLASVMHFAVVYRSPLIIQLRLWIREHIIQLVPATDAKSSRTLSPSPSISVSSSFGSNVRDSKRVSSMFTKLRPRSSAHSPDASPLLVPQTLSVTPMEVTGNNRRPGFQASPSSSLDLGSASRPIIHLGPVTFQEQPFSPLDASEENREFTRGRKQSSMLAKIDVIRLAHRDVQVILAWFGYQNDDSVSVKAWSRLDGIRAVREETRLLLIEFHESFFPTSATVGDDEAALSKES